MSDQDFTTPKDDDFVAPETSEYFSDEPMMTEGEAADSPALPLTGEEVDLPGEISSADDIIGESSLVQTGQIEPVILTPHTTTIPVMTDGIPAIVIDPVSDPTPTPRDVMANRVDTPATDEAPATPASVEASTVQRRSFMTAAPVEEVEEETETTWKPREEAVETTEPEQPFVATTPTSLDDSIFEGATLTAEMPSRAGAHWGSLLSFFILAPIAWYLAADAGSRMTNAMTGVPTIDTPLVSTLALGELLVAIVIGIALLIAACKSSLGPCFSGVITTIIGLPWLVVPAMTAEYTKPVLTWLYNWNTVGANFTHHVQLAGYSGRFLLMGIAMIFIGILSHRVRRTGRAEEVLRSEVEKVNPTSAHYTARARRKAEKAAGLR